MPALYVKCVMVVVAANDSLNLFHLAGTYLLC